MTDEAKILVTALVTSFFTACLTEPVKTVVQRWLKRRELRRALYWEVLNSLSELIKQIDMANHDDRMKEGLGRRFERWGYRRLSYDLALKDAPSLYALGHSEIYWLELMHADFQSVIQTSEDTQMTLTRAESAVYSVMSNIKNRHVRQWLAFSVSPPWLKKHLRKHLPEARYIDTSVGMEEDVATVGPAELFRLGLFVSQRVSFATLGEANETNPLRVSQFNLQTECTLSSWATGFPRRR